MNLILDNWWQCCLLLLAGAAAYWIISKATTDPIEALTALVKVLSVEFRGDNRTLSMIVDLVAIILAFVLGGVLITKNVLASIGLLPEQPDKGMIIVAVTLFLLPVIASPLFVLAMTREAAAFTAPEEN